MKFFLTRRGKKILFIYKFFFYAFKLLLLLIQERLFRLKSTARLTLCIFPWGQSNGKKRGDIEKLLIEIFSRKYLYTALRHSLLLHTRSVHETFLLFILKSFFFNEMFLVRVRNYDFNKMLIICPCYAHRPFFCVRKKFIESINKVHCTWTAMRSHNKFLNGNFKNSFFVSIFTASRIIIILCFSILCVIN